MATTAVAKREVRNGALTQATASVVPGVDNIDDRDLKIPNVVLVQELSRAFTKAGHKPGALVLDVTNTELKTKEFVPAYLTKYFIVYDIKGTEKVYVGRAKNENDPILAGRRTRSQNGLQAEVVPVILVVALIDGRPVKIQFKNISGYPAGQKLYTFAREAGVALWSRKYKLVPFEAKNKRSQEYWAIDVVPVGDSSEQEQAVAEQLYRSFKGAEAVVEAEESTEEQVPF